MWQEFTVRCARRGFYEEGVMMNRAIPKRAAIAVMTVLFATLSIGSAQSAQAAHPQVKDIAGAVSIGELGLMASGAAEDTLKACMTRIPQHASAGQRMLAKQTCAGEEVTRSVIRSAPKF